MTPITNSTIAPKTICVCTSYRADREPRAPRHAATIAKQYKDVELFFVDCAPIGEPSEPLKVLSNLPNLTWQTHFYAHRQKRAAALATNKIAQKLAQAMFKLSKGLYPAALNANIVGLQRTLEKINADIYIAHNTDTFLAAAKAAHKNSALLIFDSMEFHSDMGDSQTELECQMVKALESRYLNQCNLVLASSDEIADALVDEYTIKRPLPLYNVPNLEENLLPKTHSKLALYWRNSVIGLGQRGLDEALVALTQVPEDVVLNLQGRLAFDGGRSLHERISELGLEKRVIIHPPYKSEEAVKMASPYHIGLCMERKGIRNHELTVSNKMFDYMMAGLAVISSDLPGLRNVVKTADSGLLYTSGSADDLARQILKLYQDKSLLTTFSSNARNFALALGNRETEMQKFTRAFESIYQQPVS